MEEEEDEKEEEEGEEKEMVQERGKNYLTGPR